MFCAPYILIHIVQIKLYKGHKIIEKDKYPMKLHLNIFDSSSELPIGFYCLTLNKRFKRIKKNLLLENVQILTGFNAAINIICGQSFFFHGFLFEFDQTREIKIKSYFSTISQKRTGFLVESLFLIKMTHDSIRMHKSSQ